MTYQCQKLQKTYFQPFLKEYMILRKSDYEVH